MQKIWKIGGCVALAFIMGSGVVVAKTKAHKTAVPAKATTKATTKSDGVARDPYLGAMAVDAESGRVLFEDNAEAHGYPASTLKLMDLLIILEKIESGALKLTDQVTANAEVSKIGGTQVWLKEGESFSVDEMLYAMMVQSANDAATALAIHIAGSKEAFIELMNQRAKALGMDATVFHSVHGLPPGTGQEHDISTPRDFVKLCLELLKHKDTLRYTSAVERQFRVAPETIIRNHNHLLENYRGSKPRNFKGCDGLKTGYIKAGGYCIAVTAKHADDRVLAVIFGSLSSDVRDAKARELMSKGLADIAAYRAKHPAARPVPAITPPSAQPATNAAAQPAPPQPAPAAPPVETPPTGTNWSKIALIGLGVLVVVLVFIIGLMRRPRA
ncbi:MAG: D-alanyl-D-alanine carboxypeptidase [Verrucomicrobia bacterium]|nr:MAG: D-alanyl-D-alanine carboxypeptidase [Verrucomicrobiota bacterium]